MNEDKQREWKGIYKRRIDKLGGCLRFNIAFVNLRIFKSYFKVRVCFFYLFINVISWFVRIENYLIFI